MPVPMDNLPRPESSGDSRFLSHGEFDVLVAAMARDGCVMAPRRFGGRGRMSDTDLVRYGEVTSADEIESGIKSDFSPKEALFPIQQTLLTLDAGRVIEPTEDDRPIYLFLRACDINGIDRLDGIFLRNGPEPDVYYLRRRQRIRFVLMECARSLTNCFCVSMGANRTDNYHMAIRWQPDGVQVLVRDRQLAGLLSTAGRPSEFSPSFVTQDDAPVRVPGPDRLTAAVRERDLFNHEMWKDYAARCIACGRCNTHCVTCSCFTTADVPDERAVGRAERRRMWAACHIDRFTDMAGGHSFRQDYGSRMRFKTMHKIYDYYLRFGRHMCVGCGRCDDHCPEYISFSTCINRVSEVLDHD